VEFSILKKTKRLKAELEEGPQAAKSFERTMKILFQVPKDGSKKLRKGKD
jgi:hypothetical protein